MSASPSAPAPRVLVIDDSHVAAAAIASMFKSQGCEVFVRNTPVGAAPQIVRERIDAVVLDMNMPVMNGLQYAGVLRQNRRLSHVLLVLVTGVDESRLGSPEVREYADLLVPKRALAETVPRILGLVEQRRQPVA